MKEEIWENLSNLNKKIPKIFEKVQNEYQFLIELF